MLEIIGAGLKILQILLGKWFEFTDEKKAEVKEVLKEVSSAKNASSIITAFDRINRM